MMGYRKSHSILFVLVGVAAPLFATAKASDGLPTELIKQLKVLTVEYPREGAQVGQGWDLFLGRKTTGFCVSGSVMRENRVPSISMKFSRIEDKEQFYSLLSVSASASYSAGFGSASGKADFTRSIRINNSDLNILASVNVETRLDLLSSFVETDKSETIKPSKLELSEEAVALLKDPGGKLKFKAACGDAAIIGIRYGGEFQSILNFSTNELETKESLYAEFSAKGFGAEGGAAIRSITERLKQGSRLRFDFFQTGSSKDKNPITVDDVIDRISKYGTDDKFEPIPFQVYLLDYRALSNYPGPGADVLPTAEQLSLLANHYERLNNLADQYADAIKEPRDPSDLKKPKYNVGLLYQNQDTLLKNQAMILSAARLAGAALKLCFEAGDCANSERVSANLRTRSALGFNGNSVPPNERVEPPEELESCSGISGIRVVRLEANLLTPQEKKALSQTDDNKALQTDSVDIADFRRSSDCFYFFLGRMPPKRTDVDPRALILTPDFKDYQAEVLSELPKNEKGEPKFKAGTPAEKQEQEVQEALLRITRYRIRRWILNERLLPVSRVFCAVDAQHHMCASALRLWSVISKVAINVDIKQLNVNPPPPPAPPKPPAEIDDGCFSDHPRMRCPT